MFLNLPLPTGGFRLRLNWSQMQQKMKKYDSNLKSTQVFLVGCLNPFLLDLLLMLSYNVEWFGEAVHRTYH